MHPTKIKSIVSSLTDSGLTCERQDLEVPHATEMLQPKVTNLGAPPEEQGRQRQHGRYVAHTNVSNMDTPDGGKSKHVTWWKRSLDVSYLRNCFQT
jgi:hypothetical protein